MEACGGYRAYCGGMRVRIGFAAVSIVGLGLLSAACAGHAGPGAARPLAEPSSSAEGAPSVSWLRATPGQATPNSAVSLDVACLDDLGAVQSPVLDIGPLQGNPEGHQPWRLLGTATVRPEAAPGRYRIIATCGDGELATDFIVVAGPSR